MSLEHDNARIHKLIEREKELNCIYQIENIIRNDTLTIDQILARLVEIIPSGWQYPELCRCSITYEGNVYSGAGFDSTGNGQKSEILVGDHIAGHIEVEYDYDTGKPEKPGFLPEEQKLLNTIAGILGMTIFSRKLRSTLEYLKNARSKSNFQVNEDQILSPDSDRHWKWRYDMVNIIAEHLEMDRFGVKGMYLIGSTKNA
ncbi:MAG TPA: hypothetical protein VK994_02290, partial [Bacteroidales bacterium]|nr:hypothetical protein [Bacteroidales bacterium]